MGKPSKFCTYVYDGSLDSEAYDKLKRQDMKISEKKKG